MKKQISEYNNPLFKQCYTGEEWLCVGRHKTIKLLDRKTLPVIIGWLKRERWGGCGWFSKMCFFTKFLLGVLNKKIVLVLIVSSVV